ncbi:MAG: hypothetical protein AAF990_27115 [Bacteroidota bacterium]
MKFKLPTTDRLLGVSAIIISVLTLIIFIYQTNIINKQSKLSVKPRLSFGRIENTNDSIVTIEQHLQNKGLGPAIISEASIIYKREKFKFDFDEFINNKYPKIEDYGNLLRTTGISKDGTILPKEIIVIYKFEIPINKIEEVTKYLDLNGESLEPNWNFEVKHTSLYEDEIWTIRDKINKPIQEN